MKPDERFWGVLQDRLTSELRLAHAGDLDPANAVWRKFVADYNRRFARTPREAQKAWGPAPQNLERICCFAHERIASATTTSCSGTAGRYKFIPSLAVTALPEPKYRSIRLSTAASPSTTAIRGSSIQILPEGDIFTLPLG